jgi:hypothetical protein
MGRDRVSPIAYWNSSKLCWEVWLEEPAGDRLEFVPKKLGQVYQYLKDHGYRFIEANSPHQPHLLVITDITYWTDNQKQIEQWALEANIALSVEYMKVCFTSQEDKLMFMLRWA